MVSNAQLDNEKNNLIYQVDTLKDVIEEREEQLAEYYRENEEKSKVLVLNILCLDQLMKKSLYILLLNGVFKKWWIIMHNGL